jgi:hypothetical protein
MSRINRRKIEIDINHNGSLLYTFDNTIKQTYRIYDDEFDYIDEKATEEELFLLVNEKPTFAEKREIIKILNKYINYK